MQPEIAAQATVHHMTVQDLSPAWCMRGWLLRMRARRLSERTLQTYTAAVLRLVGFLARMGMPDNPQSLTREHIEMFLVDLMEQPGKRGQLQSTASVLNRYGGLYQYFKYLEEEGEIKVSPMARMKPPKVDVVPPPVFDLADLERLLKPLEKAQDFESRRDRALILMLIDTGLRRTELASLTCEAVLIDKCEAVVMGKGRKERRIAFGNRTAQALDRYERVRVQHRYASSPQFWLGKRGPITSNAVYQIVELRAQQAGLPHIYPHLFRHGFAHMWLAQGGQEGDLMALLGWSSRTMLMRYGASARSERARNAHKAFGIADKLKLR